VSDRTISDSETVKGRIGSGFAASASASSRSPRSRVWSCSSVCMPCVQIPAVPAWSRRLRSFADHGREELEWVADVWRGRRSTWWPPGRWTASGGPCRSWWPCWASCGPKGVDLYLHQQGARHLNAGRQGHVPDARRVRRVRAGHDRGTGAGFYNSSRQRSGKRSCSYGSRKEAHDHLTTATTIYREMGSSRSLST
jgi:hypothetical protein